MKDEDIIKALECLQKDNSTPDDREKCYFMWKEPTCFNCYHIVAKNALALINSQKEDIAALEVYAKQLKEQRDMWMKKADEQKKEIERLKAENDGYKHIDTILHTAIDKLTANIKSEAIKKFAERLKEKKLNSTIYSRICTNEMIDNLVKEMVGDSE